MKIVFLLLTAVFFSNSQAQQTSNKNLGEIQNLELSERYKAIGDIKEATRYLNEAAMIVWENKEFDKAIQYFNKSVQLNETINNESGIAKLNSNLGMIYSDKGDYQKSLEYFQQSLDYRLINGEKPEIISTYINKGVVLNNLKKYEEAAKNLEAALQLATEMNDVSQMKSCYGMLAETYEKSGNQERTIHYFNLYRTFHEMIQRNKISESKKEIEQARLQALQAELDKKEQQIALLNTTQELKLTEEELQHMDEELRSLLESQNKQQLAMSLLKREVELKELRLKEAESLNNEQRVWIVINIIVLISIIIVSLLVYRNYRYKKKVSQQLVTQNKEIKNLNENLEEQVLKRTSELQKTLTHLENRNRDLDQFSHVISHNLRGPVARILGLGTVIDLKNPQNPINFEIFGRLVSSVQDLDAVVGDLTSILNVKDNQSPLIENVNIRLAVNRASKLLKDEILQSTLTINFEGNNHIIPAVKTYLESILYNLISNAIKYKEPTSPPSIVISTTFDKNKHRLSVRDNGIGISQEFHQKIFEPYKRLNHHGSGKGIGLYMVKTQVEAMNGSVHVISKEGNGSEFIIELPDVSI